MVKLNKIYTRTGDDGTTGLVGGGRIPKHSLRIHAIGDVDETNAHVGLARYALGNAHAQADEMLKRIQHDLFDFGADLATLESENPGGALRITDLQITRLEEEIDAMNESLTPLHSFVLPGGSAASCALHMARTVARRAERSVDALAQAEWVNPSAIQYINRLSDHLFVMARLLNDEGKADVLWEPGVNR